MSEVKSVPQLALLIEDIRADHSGRRYGGSSYLVAMVAFVLRVDDSIENLRYEYGDRPFKEYADLKFRAQADPISEHLYGWSLEYREPYEVNYERAVAMGKLLKRLEDKRKEQDDFFGSAPDFVSWVMRYASIAKVRNFAWIKRTGGNYQSSEIVWLTPDGFRGYIDRRVAEFFAECKAMDAPAEVRLSVVDDQQATS